MTLRTPDVVKRRQRTHAASGGASEALPHEVGARPSRSEPKLNTHALYPSRSELRGITFKNKIKLGEYSSDLQFPKARAPLGWDATWFCGIRYH